MISDILSDAAEEIKKYYENDLYAYKKDQPELVYLLEIMDLARARLDAGNESLFSASYLKELIKKL